MRRQALARTVLEQPPMATVKVNSIPAHSVPGHRLFSLGKWLSPGQEPQVMLPEMPCRAILGATCRPHGAGWHRSMGQARRVAQKGLDVDREGGPDIQWKQAGPRIARTRAVSRKRQPVARS